VRFPLLAQAEQGTKATDGAANAAGDVASEAAEAAQNVEPTWLAELLDSGAIGLLIEGGFFMWPILILGILAVAAMIERYRSLKLLNTDSEALRREVLDLLNRDRIEEALQLCDSKRGPVPAILSAGLRKFFVLRRLGHDPARIEEQVVKSMEDYGVHVVAALERHLPILGTVASVAPMVGFLGTVQGMIVSFRNIVEKMGETNIVEAAASGIQVALLTTCFGLIVGIPAYLAFNYFTSVINRFVLDVEESSAELIEAVTLQMALESRADKQVSAEDLAAGVAD
jgi:biopolymer transport protein ExbB